jgi:hypothetical protein
MTNERLKRDLNLVFMVLILIFISSSMRSHMRNSTMNFLVAFDI